jgi:hypothetical protein
MEEERVRARHAKALARLGGPAGGRSLGLTEHEVSRNLAAVETGNRRDHVVGAIEDEQIARRRHVPRVAVADVRQRESAPPVGRVAGVEEVHLAVLVDRHVLQPRIGPGGASVYGRLVVGVEPVGLGETTRLGGVDLAIGHQGDEVVLHRKRVGLLAEGGGGLPRARETDDQHRLLLPAAGSRGREGFEAGV